ncbi:MAG: uroporphyrinogen decarboxylase family protein [Spirochaetia bacterium]|jgi:hypothetical protein
MMSARERVLAVLNGRTPDRVPWMGDLDYWVSSLKLSGTWPIRYTQVGGLFQLHRDLGVGFYLQGDFPFRADSPGVQLRENTDNGRTVTEVITPVGSIRQVSVFLSESFTWATVEHFIKSVADLRVIRYWYQGTSYSPAYAAAQERWLHVGEAGIVLSYLPKSPLMELVALLAGIETVTYAFADAPEELEETLAVMECKADEAALIAVDSPAECLMIPENLSSEVIGKRLFEKFMRPYEEKWVARIREAGKHSFIHMDGTMKGLIAEVASTGFDVLEALTPSPVGDIPLQEIEKWVPRNTIIWGGLPGLYFTDIIGDEEFDRYVIQALDIMKSHPRYVLGVADQVPPGAHRERIRRVAELVEVHGRY